MKCDLCGMNLQEEKIKHVHIKGKVKNICEEWPTSIIGLV